MRYLSVLCLLFAGCSMQANAKSFVPLAAASMAVHAQDPAAAPKIVPKGQDCPNCNGTGKLGDGTVKVMCPACHGTGKRPQAIPAGMTPATSAPVTSQSETPFTPIARAGVERMVEQSNPDRCPCDLTCRCQEYHAPVVYPHGEHRWEVGWVWHPAQKQGTAPVSSPAASGCGPGGCAVSGGAVRRVFIGRRGR